MAEKLRPDSTFSRMPDDVRDEINAALLDNKHTYTEVRDLMAEMGYKISIQQIGEYYRRKLLPQKWRSLDKTAAILDGIKSQNVDAATHAAVKHATLELATAPNADPKNVAKMYALVLKSNQLEIDKRKLEMLEAREARLKETIQDTTATTEEKEARIKELFGLK